MTDRERAALDLLAPLAEQRALKPFERRLVGSLAGQAIAEPGRPLTDSQRTQLARICVERLPDVPEHSAARAWAQVELSRIAGAIAADTGTQPRLPLENPR